MKARFQIVGCSDIFCKDNDFSRQSVRLWLLFMMLSIINGTFFCRLTLLGHHRKAAFPMRKSG
ncbi:hypothetical protein [Segatella maculosa]|uniref:hypothetical protein n=1 Tax=Segatella maculosa TaxID=439703 RepID=UPI0028D6C4F8|nr:hypothetical protein [Segatella maculosa]